MIWYLKKDVEVYGPVELATLQEWARDGRVAPEDNVSSDQQTWMPSYDIPELEMDWFVALRDGSSYGPLNRLALRDLIDDGSISWDDQVTHRETGEALTAGQAVILAASEREEELLNEIERLENRLREGVGAARPAAAPAASTVSEREKLLLQKLKVAIDLKEDFQRKLERWEKLYAEEQEKARLAQEQLDALAAGGGAAPAPGTDEARQLKDALADEQARAAAREKELQERIVVLEKALEQREAPQDAGGAAAREKELLEQIEKLKARADDSSARENAEKWKKLYDEECADAQKREGKLKKQIEKLKAAGGGEEPQAQAAAAPAEGGETVPRALLEETQKKLAQVEKSYQQLLRTLNRKLAPPPSGQPSSSPDTLRRRDVS